MAKAARHFSHGSLVVIGKTTTNVSILEKLPNVHLLGRKSYTDLPNYCKGFDVALNPFIINELTNSANPLKVREYLAAGLEVVSTDIPEVRILNYCRIGKTHDDFIRKIEEVLINPRPKIEISDSVRNESWEARVDELREIIKENEPS
jgi:glycosyltransferase involved in cell wall biosynthesis